MNIVDLKFYNLINNISSKNIDNLYSETIFKYKSLPNNIKKILESYFHKYQFWGSLNEDQNNFTEIRKKCEVLKNFTDDFIWLYEKFEDYSSRFLLYAILNNWLNYDFDCLNKSINYKYNYYFDLDILPKLKDEVFVDVGCYVGDTVEDLIFNYSKFCYKKIYCYDITSSNIEKLKNNFLNFENIVCRNKAVSDRNGYIYLNENQNSSSANKTGTKGKIKVPSITLDKDIKEKITTIKMDIEGDEEKALIGCKNHIIKDNPKLLISVYHKNEHFVSIAKLIDGFNPCYKYYLRNYGGKLYPTEIILYAIPKD